MRESKVEMRVTEKVRGDGAEWWCGKNFRKDY